MRGSADAATGSALWRMVVGIVVLVLLVAALSIGWRFGLRDLLVPNIARDIDPSGYQAVFLTGGQVFFGKVGVVGVEYFTLNDIFYLSPGDGQQASQLIKRGRELHGPREPMLINARQVQFIENLRDDSDVVVAIKKFKSGQLPIATPPPATPPSTPALTPTGTARPSPSPTR